MKLTKKIEQEVLKVYNTGWDSYMKGDLTTHSTCLSSKFKIIGTTEGENFNNKQAWLAFCKKTIHQVVGVAQMRNRKIKLDAVGDGVMVVENSNIYVLIEGKWKFYSKIRITALLQKEKTGWKYVHQHGSLPDTRASEDETLATKQVKKENLQLREAVKRRTIELEEKNRELEIEAALERIRARALAMHSSAELTDVAKVLREQMGSLGQPELETSAVHLYNEEAENIYSWRAFRLSSDSKSKITYGFFKIPKNSCAIAREFLQKFKSRASDYTIEVSGTKQSEWYKILFKLAPEVGHAMEKSGTTKEKRYYHLSKFTGGALLMVSSKEPSTDAIELQKRSAQVFDLAYRRFKDLQKVEVQAKEAQIEAALERVRSRSMAMHKSEELHDVAHLLYEQFKSLGETTIQFTIGIANEAEKLFDTSVTEWSGSGKAVFMKYKMPFSEPSLVNELFRAWQKNKPSVVIELKGVRLNKWVAYRNKLSGIKVKADKPRIITAAFFSKGFIAFSKHEESNAATVQLLERFTGVFNQTYTRFLDLQKAEVQAKEAQIEAALERVRSQTMAMHNSEDMGKCILKMFNELTGLGIHEGTRFGIGILNHENENNQLWTARKQGDEINMHIGSLDMNLHPLLKSARKAWKEQLPLHTYILKGEDLLSYYRMLNDAPDYKILVPIEKLPEKEFHYGFVFEHGFFYAFTPREFQPDLIHIAQRFAKVFEQTYRRYLDLVKAETQAREAQIEAAIERVRSRSLAMYKSDELREVLQLIFEQLWQLNFNIDSAQFGLNYKESDDLNVWTAVPGQPYPTLQHIPYFSNPVMDSAKQAKEMGLTFFSHIATREEKNKFFNHFFSHIKTVPQDRQKYILDRPGFARSVVFLDTVFLGIQNYSGTPYTDTENAVLRRFGKVFEQSYTRFLDLQKAEVQAREAQIEAALERVRSASLAMHHSEDLEKVVSVLSQRLVDLGFAFDGTLIFIFDKSKSNITLWIATVQLPAPLKVNLPYEADMMENPVLVDLWNAIVRKENNINRTYTGKVKDDYFRYVARYNRETISEELQQLHLKLSAWSMSYVAKENAVLAIDSWSGHVVGENEFLILNRFAVVFEQAYTRFLDLQKAEVQAREAQIEAALERVRSRSMAMHNSADLSTVVFDMFTELVNLDAQLDRCLILIVNPHTLGITWYLTGKEGLLSDNGFLVQDNDHPSHKAYLEGWRTRRKKWKYLLAGEEKKNWDTFGFSQTGLAQLPEFIKADMANVEAIHLTISSDSFGCLIASSLSPLADEHAAIVERFTLVFNQTYTRFLDLQKAEAQAREAQIEAALERVRSRSMAMHKSEELLNVITVVSDQLQQLNFKFNTVSFAINSQQHDYTFWFAILGDPNPIYIQVPYINNPMFDRLKDVLAQGLDFYADTLGPEESRAWHEHVFAHAELPSMTEETKAYILRSGYARSIAIKPSIMLIVSNYAGKPYSDNENEILKRFATVFEQSYTRFLDLQKAEAQAREAQIEAALERVRSKAMAMHSSEDLSATIYAFYHELELFSITPRRCGVGLLDKETRMAELSTMNTTEQGQSIEVIGKLKMIGHPVLEGIYVNWLAQEEYHPVLRGNEIKEYYQIIRPQVAFPEYPNDAVQYGYFFFFAEGGVYAWTEKELLEDELKIYRRFTTVLSLAYKRYKDLKDAEAREQEAIKQSALDRVRADIASMRSTTDLERITPLIWSELTTLGVPFIRCGVFIMDEHGNKVHSYLSTPDGRAIAAFHTPMDDSGSLAGAIEHWRQQKIFVTHWVESDFQKQAEVLLKHGSITTHEQYLNTLPKEGFHLHFLPFRQGMLYVGSLESLPSDVLQLVQSLADAFSVAYARYEDFTKLELAKAQIENTLSDLKQTQTQLIQSEKMASLGELTAGIAHEIQNPLNFVNNFSEVSTELVKEMVDELEKGNLDEVKVIANDVVQNLEKINHHGKRAADIVKGMLQHSRSSSGQKELTDINALADEYLRLAYHGLRAKDKSFNATMKTDFDETIGKINVVPQDIGRVILNLITNAFYAVSEKQKVGSIKSGSSYEPTVTVSTKNLGKKIEISVKDNGNGIPDSIKEKIFQPFFTTKPTGQGTGLGLSLSYDIVKAHGGELKVETSDGEGSTFTIQIPMALQ